MVEIYTNYIFKLKLNYSFLEEMYVNFLMSTVTYMALLCGRWTTYCRLYKYNTAGWVNLLVRLGKKT